MSDTFDIYVHHLSEGHREKIEKTFSADFLAIHEADLVFRAPVTLLGEVEMANGTLILKLKAHTEATMPCVICNREVQVPISTPHFCYTEDLRKVKKGIFNYRDLVREEILLALPSKIECHGGHCPEREAIAKYLSNNTKKDRNPFEDL